MKKAPIMLSLLLVTVLWSTGHRWWTRRLHGDALTIPSVSSWLVGSGLSAAS